MHEHDEHATFGVSEVAIECPFCWETVTVLVDRSVAEQRYVEDCEVCCRPMDLSVAMTPDGPAIHVEQGN